MDTLSVNKSHLAERYGKRNLPVPRKNGPEGEGDAVPLVREKTQAAIGKNTGRRVLLRATAPFLAQLSVQYDGVKVQRSARRDRIERAAQSYAGAMARRQISTAGGRHDLQS